MTEDKLIELLSNLQEGDTWVLDIPNGTIEVYYDGSSWAVECVSDEYDESYMYDDITVTAKEILYYL